MEKVNLRLLTPALSSFEEEREIYFVSLCTQGCARGASLALGYFLFALLGLQFVSFIEEQFPLGDAVGVAEVRRHRQFLRRARDGEELEAGLVREAVGLALVHFLR